MEKIWPWHVTGLHAVSWPLRRKSGLAVGPLLIVTQKKLNCEHNVPPVRSRVALIALMVEGVPAEIPVLPWPASKVALGKVMTLVVSSWLRKGVTCHRLVPATLPASPSEVRVTSKVTACEMPSSISVGPLFIWVLTISTPVDKWNHILSQIHDNLWKSIQRNYYGIAKPCKYHIVPLLPGVRCSRHTTVIMDVGCIFDIQIAFYHVTCIWHHSHIQQCYMAIIQCISYSKPANLSQAARVWSWIRANLIIVRSPSPLNRPDRSEKLYS